MEKSDLIFLKDALSKWAATRWLDWAMEEKNGQVEVHIYASDNTNKIAINAYIRVVHEAFRNYAPDCKSVVYIYIENNLVRMNAEGKVSE